jgi:photoactive yellow protein
MAALLVVEDDDDLREFLTVLLEGEGHEVTGVASGLEAAVRAGRERYDLVLLDLDLPELSGDAVARVVGDLGAAPVIALSGRGGAWQGPLLAAGAAACLEKPYDVGALVSLIRANLLSRSEGEGPWPTDVRALSPDDLAAVARLSPAEQDRLPFGAIAVGEDGRIEAFNAYEADASSYAAPTVVGLPFRDVAPCTEVKGFSDRLARGLRGEPLDEVLRFVFPRFGATSLVSVRLFRDPTHDRVWVFVSERGGRED